MQAQRKCENVREAGKIAERLHHKKVLTTQAFALAALGACRTHAVSQTEKAERVPFAHQSMRRTGFSPNVLSCNMVRNVWVQQPCHGQARCSQQAIDFRAPKVPAFGTITRSLLATQNSWTQRAVAEVAEIGAHRVVPSRVSHASSSSGKAIRYVELHFAAICR